MLGKWPSMPQLPDMSKMGNAFATLEKAAADFAKLVALVEKQGQQLDRIEARLARIEGPTCQQGAPCGNPDVCPDPIGCDHRPIDDPSGDHFHKVNGATAQ